MAFDNYRGRSGKISPPIISDDLETEITIRPLLWKESKMFNLEL